MELIQTCDGTLEVPKTFIRNFCHFDDDFLKLFSSRVLTEYLDYALRVVDVKPHKNRVEQTILDMVAESYSGSHGAGVVGARIGFILSDASYLDEITKEEAIRIAQYHPLDSLQSLVSTTLRAQGIGHPPLNYVPALLACAQNVFTMDEWIDQLSALGPEYITALGDYFSVDEIVDCSLASRLKLPWKDCLPPQPIGDTIYCAYSLFEPHEEADFPPWTSPLWIFRKPNVKSAAWDLLVIDRIEEREYLCNPDDLNCVGGFFGYGNSIVQYAIFNGHATKLRLIDLATGEPSPFYRGSVCMDGSLAFSGDFCLFACGERLFVSDKAHHDRFFTEFKLTIDKDGVHRVEPVLVDFEGLAMIGIFRDRPPLLPATSFPATPIDDDIISTATPVPKHAVYSLTSFKLVWNEEEDHSFSTRKITISEFDADRPGEDPTWTYEFNMPEIDASYVVGPRHLLFLASSPLGSTDSVTFPGNGEEPTITWCYLPESPNKDFGKGMAYSATCTLGINYTGDVFVFDPSDASNPFREMDGPYQRSRSCSFDCDMLHGMPHIVQGDYRNFEIDPWKESARQLQTCYKSSRWEWDERGMMCREKC